MRVRKGEGKIGGGGKGGGLTPVTIPGKNQKGRGTPYAYKGRGKVSTILEKRGHAEEPKR